MNDIEEFKAITKIIPIDELTAMKICDAVEKFRYENPEEYKKVMEKERRKFLGTKSFREFMEAFDVE